MKIFEKMTYRPRIKIYKSLIFVIRVMLRIRIRVRIRVNVTIRIATGCQFARNLKSGTS